MVTVGPWTVVVVVVVVVLLLELGPAGESGIEGNGSVLLLLPALMRREPGRDDAIMGGERACLLYQNGAGRDNECW